MLNVFMKDLTLYFTKTNYFCIMNVTTTFFKVKAEKALIGVKYLEKVLSGDRAGDFSRTIYLPGKQPDDNQVFQKVDLDEFLDICNYYNLLAKHEDSPMPQSSTC
jgi:hypothetical protein